MWLTNIIFSFHGNGCSGLNVCKVSLSCVLVQHNYRLEHAIIACGHLTNMQGCHGNCSGRWYVCAEYRG